MKHLVSLLAILRIRLTKALVPSYLLHFLRYNKLAIQYHPDRNRGCTDCAELMEELNRAYETLKDEEKRAIYDQTFGSFDAITSAAIELTVDNYDDYVMNSNKMWVIQVYAEW